MLYGRGASTVPVTPVLPSEIKAIIPRPDENLCSALVKVFLKFPVLVYRWFRYEYKQDGNFTDEYAAKICASLAECPDNS